MWYDYKGNEYESKEEAWHDFVKYLSWAKLADYAKLDGQCCMLSDLLKKIYLATDSEKSDIINKVVENAMIEYFHDCYYSKEEE